MYVYNLWFKTLRYYNQDCRHVEMLDFAVNVELSVCIVELCLCGMVILHIYTIMCAYFLLVIFYLCSTMCMYNMYCVYCMLPYSGKLSREKTFTDFEVREPPTKVFSVKFGGVPHPPMIGFEQSVKVFFAKFLLPMDPRKFSPSKIYCYTVYVYTSHSHSLSPHTHTRFLSQASSCQE